MDNVLNENKINIPLKGFTHGGKFHSDDVFATAFLKIINPDIVIERGFEVPEEFAGIVYDIGRGKFDHHQADKEYRQNGCPYAAFGLIWREYGSLIFDEEEVKRFDLSFVQPLDESDNTGSDNTLADIIDEFNPNWDSDESYDDCFFRAVDFAKQILENHFKAVKGVMRAKALVDKAMEDCDGSILILPEFAPWKNVVVGSTYKFVVYPSIRGGYSVQGVPISLEDRTLVCPFPEEWCGRQPEELVEMTGIKTLRFCHPNAFLAAAEEREDAVKTAQLVLDKYVG